MELMMKHLKYVVVLLMLSAWFSGSVYASEAKKFLWNKAYFYNFYSVSPLPGGDVWAVGSNGMVCRLNPETYEWYIQEPGLHGNLYSVIFVDAKHGWICGQEGQIAYTRDGGKSWNVQKSGSKEHLFSICFTDVEKGWLVGAYGTILHTTDGGKSWHVQGEKADKIYNRVYFHDSQYGWIVGEFGTILHTEDGGLNWKAQKSPLGEKNLFCVYFKDRQNGWIAGMDGSILESQDGGETWKDLKSPMVENLMGIQVIGERGWVVGLKGSYGILTDGTWKDVTRRVPTRAWLKDCVFVDEKNGWIAGSVGTLLHTIDGGKTWFPAYKSGKK
jgi:photosystem II stability/assembly factor-like uncharacterized protein